MSLTSVNMNYVGEDVIVSSGLNDKENCIVIDPETGNVITSFKGCNSPMKCLATVGRDYIVSVLKEKPILQVWSWHSNNRVDNKIILPGIPGVMDVTTSGHHCIMGINNKIYIWHVSTGNLLKVIDYHPTNIKCLKFSKCERYVVSAGVKEASLVVWDMLKVLDSNQVPRPLYTFHDHNSVIDDIYVSSLGSTPKAVSCGKDCSCFVYDLSNGERIFSLFHDVPLTSVVMDPCQFFLYLGSESGDIYVAEMHDEKIQVSQENLTDASEKDNLMDTSEKKNVKKWHKEHSDAITCLSISSDSRYLLSGSMDGTTRLWDLCYAKCIKTFKHQGEVTNAFFTIAPYSLAYPDRDSLELVFAPLKRSINTSNSSEDVLIAKLSSEVPRMVLKEPSDELINHICFRDICVEPKQKSTMERELMESKTVTEQLYSFVMGTFLNNVRPELVHESSE